LADTDRGVNQIKQDKAQLLDQVYGHCDAQRRLSEFLDDERIIMERIINQYGGGQ
jgi:hypothetical protein